MSLRIFSLFAVWPRTTLVFWFLFTGVCAAGITGLKFDFSPESVYAGQDAAVQFCEQHKRMFRFEDSVCLVLLESTDDRQLLREDCVLWLQDLAKQSRSIPGVTEVSSLLTLQRPIVKLESAGSSDDAITWVPLFAPADLRSEPAIQDRLDRLPLLNDLLISSDRKLLLTLIILDPNQRGLARTLPVVRQVESLVASLPLPAATRTHLSGIPPIRVDIIRSLQTDQTIMVPLCAGLFTVVSLLMFRSIPVMLVSLMAVLSSVGITVGLMGWTGQEFNLLSNVVPPLALIIAAANVVHIVSRLRNILALSPASPQQAVVAVMQEMSLTCFLTLSTTAIGFGSLWLARSQLLQSLAFQAVIAMVCNYAGLMIVLTAGLALTAPAMQLRLLKKQSRQLHSAGDAGSRALRILADWIVKRATSIVSLHFLLAVACLLWSSDMRINSLMFETYDPDHPVMSTIQLLDEKLSGMVSLEIQLRAESKDDFFRHDVAAGVRRLRSQLAMDPRVTFSRDYTQILEAFDSRTASPQISVSTAALQRINRISRNVDISRITRDFIAVDQPAARVMMRVHDIGSAGLTELIADVNRLALLELPPDIRPYVTGDAALHAISMHVFVRDLFVSLITASGIIFFLIAVIFRSPRLGLISVFPNLMPLVVTLAWMKFRGFELTAGNVIVFAISVGIAVDDTIHFLARYREESRRQAPASETVHTVIMDCGRAIILTSVLIVSGLSILIFSDFVPTRRFAELTSITMLAALPGDLILLPALLKLWGIPRFRASPLTDKKQE